MRNIARKFLDYVRKVSLSCKHVYVVFEIVNAIMLSPRASMAALCAPLIVLFAWQLIPCIRSSLATSPPYKLRTSSTRRRLADARGPGQPCHCA